MSGKTSLNNGGKKTRCDDEANPAPLESTASFQEFLEDGVKNEEEKKDEEVEEESDVLLALSESSPSEDDDLAEPNEPESEREQESVMTTAIPLEAVEADDDDHGVTSSDESRSSVIHLQVKHVPLRCMLMKCVTHSRLKLHVHKMLLCGDMLPINKKVL